HHAAGFVTDQRIAAGADFLVADFARHDPIKKLLRVRPRKINPPHVRDIEDAAAAARLLVLLDDRAVDDGHFPSREVNHPSAGGDMKFVKWRALQHEPRDGISGVERRQGKAWTSAPNG